MAVNIIHHKSGIPSGLRRSMTPYWRLHQGPPQLGGPVGVGGDRGGNAGFEWLTLGSRVYARPGEAVTWEGVMLGSSLDGRTFFP